MKTVSVKASRREALLERGGPVGLRRRLVAEALGCGLLVVALEGAHHVAEHLGASATEGRLFMSFAAGAVLACLTLAFRPLSGAHFNPALTFAGALEQNAPWQEVPLYVLAQVLGSLGGRLLAHLMCHEPLLITVSEPAASDAQFLTEAVATFGLLVVVGGCMRTRPAATPFVIPAYVAATVWFTDSRSLANPALVLARAASERPDLIRPFDVESFVAAQLLGAALAVCLFRWLFNATSPREARPHTVLFDCPVAGPPEVAAALFNQLAHPQQARARAPSFQTRTENPSWRILLEPEGCPAATGPHEERWVLPALSSSKEENLRAWQEALRPRIQELLARQGWKRLHLVESHPPKGPQEAT
ncbi:aquaporin [Stigmatella sp. ncwal1]|uniref:Aquaporin n=1 Tax=Stigmatella ashevillensis TaxID=2995309 RepID=A0ABT5DBG4_9BACT|nr:aquaporin [Stigmatella ashevillena]MDC0710981.1 aquaporin [Stigmatella ashevillena]